MNGPHTSTGPGAGSRPDTSPDVPADLGETVLAVIGDVLNQPAGTLRDQPVLAAYDWDSLASLEALAQLEGRFAIRLDLLDFHAARVVDDVTALVAEALHGN